MPKQHISVSRSLSFTTNTIMTFARKVCDFFNVKCSLSRTLFTGHNRPRMGEQWCVCVWWHNISNIYSKSRYKRANYLAVCLRKIRLRQTRDKHHLCLCVFEVCSVSADVLLWFFSCCVLLLVKSHVSRAHLFAYMQKEERTSNRQTDRRTTATAAADDDDPFDWRTA